jgi:large subunit ribosomal protein L24
MSVRIKKGDKVVVTTGKDKGATGRVLLVDVERERALIEGVNLVKRHQSAQKYGEAGIVEKEAPIHLSNIMIEDPKDGGPSRVRAGVDKDGKKVRIAAKSGVVIPD